VTAGATLDFSRTEEKTPGTLTSLGRDLVTATLLGDVQLDRSDNPLDPRRGYKLNGRVEPTLIVGETNLPYLRLQAQGSYYLPLDKAGHTVVAARVKVGRILNGSIPEVPASRRFYAGGGGSVRGFGYQDVGDKLADGTPLGGLSLFEASGEVRRDISSRWGVAAFVDAGSIGSTGPIDLAKLAVGAGVGVRYSLGIIPIRVDVATPVMNRHGAAAFNVYISIGQSF
jgi:translocation and assembly module TamA